MLLLLCCTIAAHAISSFRYLGQCILTGNICHPQRSKADGKIGAIPSQPIFGRSDHGRVEISIQDTRGMWHLTNGSDDLVCVPNVKGERRENSISTKIDDDDAAMHAINIR